MPRIPLEQVAADPVLAAHRYWSSKRVGDRLPARGDIDPAEIPQLLPYVILSEVLTPFSVRYRLVGTAVVAMNNLDFTGYMLNEGVIGEEWQAYCAEHYRIVVATGAPLFGADRYEYRERDFQPFQWAIMPLAADGHTVDMCLEIEAPLPSTALAGTPLLAARPRRLPGREALGNGASTGAAVPLTGRDIRPKRHD